MDELTTTVSVQRQVSDGNYGHATVFVSLNGIRADTTPEEMDEMLDQAGIAYKRIKAQVLTKVSQLTPVDFK